MPPAGVRAKLLHKVRKRDDKSKEVRIIHEVSTEARPVHEAVNAETVYYDVIGQKNCFYLVSGFKFFLSKKIKIIIGKVFYSGNFFIKPCSKEDRIIVNFNIFFVPYDRFFCTGLGIILPILKLKTSIAAFLCRRVVAP